MSSHVPTLSAISFNIQRAATTNIHNQLNRSRS